ADGDHVVAVREEVPHDTVARPVRPRGGTHERDRLRVAQDFLRRPHGPKLSSGHTRRSEEHTSELQSRFDVVCRLLLEQKKNRGPNNGCVTADWMRFGKQTLNLTRASDHACIAEDPPVTDDVPKTLAGK